MQKSYSENRHKINLETWERKALFDLFENYSEPYHGACIRVDCTETFRYAKEHQFPIFLSLLHRSLAAAQKVENFRTSIIDRTVWIYDRVNGGSVVARPNGTIGFARYRYRENIKEFIEEATIEVARVKTRLDLERYDEANLIRHSTLPWLDFTSISHARDFSRDVNTAPWITFGKITETGGRRSMPISIHAHHALADGLHVGQFVEVFQKFLNEPA